MVNPDEFRDLVHSCHEWLLVSSLGRSFPLDKHEIEIEPSGQKARLGFLDDSGYHVWRLNAFSFSEGEIELDAVGTYGRDREVMRLIPRSSAAALAAEIEIARLKKANEIAHLAISYLPGAKLGRVALNAENGRLAQIHFDPPIGPPMAAIADVTDSLTSEAIFTAAILWLEKLGSRKKRSVNDIWIVCEKRHTRVAQKLHALLHEKWKSKISVFEIDRKSELPCLRALATKRIAGLWREKAPKLVLPRMTQPSDTATWIIALAPAAADVIYSRQGETMHLNGLPFARVRSIQGREKAWFGVGRDRQLLTEENWNELKELVRLLKQHRSPSTANKRHQFSRAAPEAWLESILCKNIRLLDANLILSPIYNQFRSSNDKIDLLALRKDGRLVIIELKAQPDREMVFQAAEYWRKIELQRRRGILAAADLFDGHVIADKPAIIYLAAPAWSFHRDFEFFAGTISPDIELWRFELHENWRSELKVLARHNYTDPLSGLTKR